MPKSKTSFLVDVNVWLAIVYDLHVHHEPAMAWFSSLGSQSACLCRITQLGLLRLLTNTKVMGVDVRGQAQAWRILDALLEDERVSFLAEPSDLDVTFRLMTKTSQPAVNVWTDAYLAAFSRAAGVEMATFDRAFSRMPGLHVRLLP